MGTFKRTVVESRAQRVVYTIEAKTDAEADQKAAIGDTVSEEEEGSYDVIQRDVVADGR